jgi:hypothetical protein
MPGGPTSVLVVGLPQRSPAKPASKDGRRRPRFATLYLYVFVLDARDFLKVLFLHDLAPTGSEPPFAIAQGIALLVFIVLGMLAARRFRPGSEARA